MRIIKASGYFDGDWYLKRYPDVAQGKHNPLEHYVRFGGLEGREPSANYSTKRYLSDYPDVAASGVNPLAHYLQYGKQEGRILYEKS